jgi:hypothetical protein
MYFRIEGDPKDQLVQKIKASGRTQILSQKGFVGYYNIHDV